MQEGRKGVGVTMEDTDKKQTNKQNFLGFPKVLRNTVPKHVVI